MSVYRYDEVSATGYRKGICPICGKRGQRQKTITNTVNPFNRNMDGTVRTPAEVRAVVTAKAKAGEGEPFMHASCEDRQTYGGAG